MPTPTYDLIEEKVLSTTAASVTFSSIPGTYKDLVLEIVGSFTTTNGLPTFRYNSDSATNYSLTTLRGNGTAAGSFRFSNQTYVWAGDSNSSANTMFTTRLNVQSYANTNVNKTCLARHDNSTSEACANVGLWRSTNAITTILVSDLAAGTYASGTTFRLWGITG